MSSSSNRPPRRRRSTSISAGLQGASPPIGHVRDLPAKDGSVRPDEDFAMLWEVDTAVQEAAERDRQGGEERRRPRSSPPTRTARARRFPGTCWRCCNRRRRSSDKPVSASSSTPSPRRPCSTRWPIRATSTSRWSTPISRAARSTISSASPCRRCCGASCRAPARRAASSRWRCASSATAKPRSSASSRKNTGRSPRCSTTPRGDEFDARLTGFDGKKLQQAVDRRTATAPRRSSAMLEGGAYRVDSVEAKPPKRNPRPPFTTSTLQQAASAKLGFSAARTMQIAQRLYEGVDIGGETVGLITYMRTDGVQMAPEAIDGARNAIGDEIRRAIRARKAAPLRDQGEERAGGPRGDPPDRLQPRSPTGCRALARRATRHGSTT